MLSNVRVPAWTPPPAVTAAPWPHDPSAALEAAFAAVLRERMAGLPFVNVRLPIRAIDFARVAGDWLGGLVTPWCVQLMLLPGGGSLWRDVPAGTRSAVPLPVGPLPFIADTGEGAVAAFQYFPLVNAVAELDAEGAESIVRDALATALAAPAAPEPPCVDEGRRGFLRLGGR